MGLPVIGNIVSDEFSLNALWIGLAAAAGFIIIGLLLDKKGVDKDVQC
jgi:hypothetical protein